MFNSADLTDRELDLLRNAEAHPLEFLAGRDRRTEIMELLVTICDLRQEFEQARRIRVRVEKGETWYWQGDGYDYPESIACPVIMSAETLRALLARADDPAAAPPSVGRHDLLVDLQAWLKHQLNANTEIRSRGKGGHDGDGNSWSVVAIPEWSVRQKLAAINSMLNIPLSEVVELEMELRRLMWLSHGHSGLYGDDGEMQCQQCIPFLDYRRAPLEEVRAAYTTAILERAAKARLEKDASKDPNKPVSPPRG